MNKIGFDFDAMAIALVSVPELKQLRDDDLFDPYRVIRLIHLSEESNMNFSKDLLSIDAQNLYIALFTHFAENYFYNHVMKIAEYMLVIMETYTKLSIKNWKKSKEKWWDAAIEQNLTSLSDAQEYFKEY